MDFKDNIQLIRDLKDGNEEAYTFIVNHYHHRLCVYAKSLTNDHEKAQDIVQNVFLRTWEKRGDLKADFSVKNFLYKSVYHEFVDQHRKKTAITALEKKYIAALDLFVEETDTDTMDRLMDIVKIAIQDLPSIYKDTIMLSKQDGLTNAEISEYLNVTIKTVEARITKAYAIIRKKALEKTKHVLLFFSSAKKNLTELRLQIND